MKLHTIFISLLFSLFTLSCFSQEDLPVPATPKTEEFPLKKKHYLFSPRVSVTVPHPIADKSFKKCFVGIYEVSAGLNIFFYKGLFVGVTGKNGLLKITENKIADYNARMQINNVGGKIGGDLYVGENNKAILSFAVTVGHNWTQYSGLKWRDASKPPLYTSYETNLIEPETNIFFLIESNFAIGATVSYSIFDSHFDPYDLNLNEYSKFSSNNSVSTQYLSFGFGFYYSIVPKKR